jgi:hypothetical protein
MTIHLAAGAPKSNPWGVLYDVLRDKPLITVLLVIQLIGTLQMTAASITVLRTSTSAYVRNQPNAESMTHRLVWSSVPLAVVGFLWLLSAIGVWQRQLWAWWAALTLNGVGRDDNYHSTIRNHILTPGQAQWIPVGLSIHCRSRSIIAPWGQN